VTVEHGEIVVADRAERCQQLADRATKQTDRAKEATVVAFDSWLELGRELSAQRAEMPSNNEYGAWLRSNDNFGVTRQWLNRCMVAAEYAMETQFPTDELPRNINKLYRIAQDETARQIEPATPDQDTTEGPWTMLAGDMRERLAELPPSSVDLIVTDPPYPNESLPLWSALAEHAARLLKPQGILVAMTGKIHLLEVMNRLADHLTYGWAYCDPMREAGTRILARHIAQTWKPWLAFSNGPWPSGRIDWHPDTLEANRRTKDQYWWQQGDGGAAMLIDHLSAPGDTVLDPFTGIGTFGAAALRQGRRFVGVEMDTKRHDQASNTLDGSEV